MENKTDKPAKRKPGRPTKYQGPQTIAQVYAIVARLRSTPSDFLQLCGMEQLADQLDVSRDTLFEWSKIHPEFSDCLKSWLTARNACLYRLAKTLPPAIWIFMCKNWLGWRDKQTLEFPGANDALRFQFGDPAEQPQTKFIVEYVTTKWDGTTGPADPPRPPMKDRPFPPPPVVGKQAAELSDAELEAEIARLQREEKNADTP
jgi:hypothetical protein